MSSVLDPRARIFVSGSRAERYTHAAGIVSVVLFLITIVLMIAAVWRGGQSWGVVIAALAMLWAVGAPAWFWYEYFFMYRLDGEPGSFDLYKHGQQVSIAIWAGLAVSLGALASSDFFKEKEALAAVVTDIKAGQAVAPPPPMKAASK